MYCSVVMVVMCFWYWISLFERRMRPQSAENERTGDFLMYLRYCIFSATEGAERWIFSLSLREVKDLDIQLARHYLCIYCQRLRALDIIGFQKTSLTYHKSTYSRARKSATSLSRMSTRFWSRVENYMTYSLLICCDCNFPKIVANSRF